MREEINLKKYRRYRRWHWLFKTGNWLALCLSWMLLIPLIARLEEKAEERQKKHGN